MKKNYSILLFLLVVCITSAVNAQPFKKGTNVASIGIGLGSNLLTSYSGYSSSPAISLQYERGIQDIGGPGTISLGGYFGYKSYTYSNINYNDKITYTIIGVRGAYHYNGFNSGKDELSKLDVYGGIMVSANLGSEKFTNYNGYTYRGGSFGSTAGITAFVGGRYFFTDNIAAMAELGYGISYLTIGVSLKF